MLSAVDLMPSLSPVQLPLSPARAVSLSPRQRLARVVTGLALLEAAPLVYLLAIQATELKPYERHMLWAFTFRTAVPLIVLVCPALLMRRSHPLAALLAVLAAPVLWWMLMLSV